MSDEEEEEVIRWPDEGSYNPEPDEPEIEEKEPEEIEEEELEKQQAAEQLRAKLFGEGAPFAAEAPAWLQARPAQEQTAQEQRKSGTVAAQTAQEQPRRPGSGPGAQP